MMYISLVIPVRTAQKCHWNQGSIIFLMEVAKECIQNKIVTFHDIGLEDISLEFAHIGVITANTFHFIRI